MVYGDSRSSLFWFLFWFWFWVFGCDGRKEAVVNAGVLKCKERHGPASPATSAAACRPLSLSHP
jgi:hypothetical protein